MVFRVTAARPPRGCGHHPLGLPYARDVRSVCEAPGPRFNEFMTHLRPVRTDVTRAEALTWKRNPLEAARIASSLKAAAADSGVTAEMPADDLS
jgi:hypothetical protein